MSAAESVVFALAGEGERAYAVEFPVRVEYVTPSGQYLVSVGLVSYIPNDAVVGGVEHVVEGDGEFYDTETRGQMARIDRQLTDDVGAQFVTNGRQFVDRKSAEVCW